MRMIWDYDLRMARKRVLNRDKYRRTIIKASFLKKKKKRAQRDNTNTQIKQKTIN